MNGTWPVLAALLPSLGVGVLFFVAMRYILRADRNERQALARLDAAEQELVGRSGGGESSGPAAS